MDDLPCRIVVVGQESGHGLGAVGPACRRGTLRALAVDCRFRAGGGFPARNAHMRGTTSLLRLLLNCGLGSDYAGEFVKVSDEPAHGFEPFALVNFFRGSGVRGPGSAVFRGGHQGLSTPVMQEHCAEHFRVALTRLQPTVPIAQGRAVRRWLGPVLDEVEPIPCSS